MNNELSRKKLSNTCDNTNSSDYKSEIAANPLRYDDELRGIDVIKFICAILVIIIHTDPFRQWFLIDKAFGVLNKVAVPFFFTASSFFLFKKINSTDLKQQQKYFIRWIRRLVVMYAVWFIIYLPYYIYVNGLPNNIWTIIRILFVIGTSSHLWFIPALIFAAFAVFLMNKVISTNKILIIGLICIVSGTVIKTYGPVIPIMRDLAITKIAFKNDDIFFNNGLVYGIFYVALGLKFTGKNAVSGSHTKIILLICSFFLLAIEGTFVTMILHSPSTANYLMAIPATYMLYNFAYTWNASISEKMALLIRKISSLSYNIHFIFIYVLEIIGWERFSLKMFIVDTASTLIFSFIIILLTKHMRVLKCLY